MKTLSMMDYFMFILIERLPFGATCAIWSMHFIIFMVFDETTWPWRSHVWFELVTLHIYGDILVEQPPLEWFEEVIGFLFGLLTIFG
jgi:hypothetical protein